MEIKLERRFFWMGSIILLVVLLYVFGWRSFVIKSETYYQATQEKRALLAWMEREAKRVQTLKNSATHVWKDRQGQSLLGLISSLAKQKKLDTAIRRIQPTGEGEVQVWLEQTSFDQALLWLVELQTYQIRMDHVVVRRSRTGLGVDLDVIFQAPSTNIL